MQRSRLDHAGREFVQDLAEAPVEDRDHLVDLLGGRDQRRPEGDPVRVEAAEQAVGQRPAADPDAEAVREGLLGGPVADELDGLEQPLAADVADDPVLLRQPLEPGAEPLALAAGVAAEVALEDLAEHGDPRGAGDRVPLEGVPLDEAGVLLDRPPEGVGDRAAADHRRERGVAAAQPLGHAEHVGHDAERLGGEHPAGPADAGDDLVEDQQDVVPVADLPQDRQVLVGRVDHAAGVPDRLDHDRGDRVGVFHLDDLLDDRGAGDAAVGVATCRTGSGSRSAGRRAGSPGPSAR